MTTKSTKSAATKILITGDLHYDITRSRESAEKLAREVCQIGGDALILAGDTAGADSQWFQKALALFKDFKGVKALVMGNHCLWCDQTEQNPTASLERYTQLIPEIAAKEDFIVLDHEPVKLGDVSIVGSIGWYDYSMRDAGLAIPVEFYRHKVSPGAARYLGKCEDVFARHGDKITDRQLSIGARWMDGQRVKLGMDDEEFVDFLVEKLEKQIIAQSSSAKQIIAVTHHLPFAQLVPENRPDRFAFAAAYLGSTKFGEMLTKHKKITHAYSAHSHWAGRYDIGGIAAVNVGSTYIDKNLEILEV